ncbi:Ankyrin repeat and KH domain-containing protein mask [Diplonema papillatum]|nr:Ankyrin repeat and KH domain-containing protein mask [Diplonema papillatum]
MQRYRVQHHRDYMRDAGLTQPTPLILASEKGFRVIVEKLLQAGAVVSAKDARGHTALLLACWAGHDKVVDSLLLAGAFIDERDTDGATPLMKACWKGSERVLHRLIEAGADLDAVVGFFHPPLPRFCPNTKL